MFSRENSIFQEVGVLCTLTEGTYKSGMQWGRVDFLVNYREIVSYEKIKLPSHTIHKNKSQIYKKKWKATI